MTLALQTPADDDGCDVLIVGAGPSGLAMAMNLVRMGIKPMVIDAAGYESHEWGRGDAMQPRAMEIMQSFGEPFEQLETMGKKIYGRAFWEINGNSSRRTALARFFPLFLDFEQDYALTVRQSIVEQVMIDDIQRHCRDFGIYWHWRFHDMEIFSASSGPSTVTIHQTQTGQVRKVIAKYVVAADGARSSVRRWATKHGVHLVGENRSVTWCVLDVVGVKSDHPDLERLSVLRSSKGIVLVIPREPINGKPSVRFDIQLANTKKEATLEEAIQLIREIFYPFNVDWDEVNWWSAYEVGQKLINQYSVGNFLFFVGDACHTHSPRAGLGLNTAFLESHNLAWKIKLVLKGLALPQILSTYQQERLEVATELIQMDRRLVDIYAGLEQQSIDDFSNATEWLSTLNTFQASHYAYQAGASIVYPGTLITASPKLKRETVRIGKPDVVVGARTRPAIVTRLSDSVPVPILSPFDGRFTIYFLVGDLSKNNGVKKLVEVDTFVRGTSIFSRFGSFLSCKPSHERLAPLQRPLLYSTSYEGRLPMGRALYTYAYDDIPQATEKLHGAAHSLFNTAIITTLGNTAQFVGEHITPLIYPQSSSPHIRASPIFRPHRLFSDDLPIVSPYRDTAPEAGNIFEHPMHSKWGVDPLKGAIVVARPDGHVGLKTTGFDMDAWSQVENYFEDFLIPRKKAPIEEKPCH